MLSLLLALSTVLCADAGWQLLPGQLGYVEADTDYNLVCGTNFDLEVFCSPTSSVSWYKLPGLLAQVSIANGSLFGVNADNDVFYYASVADGQANFVKVPGKLTRISFDGTTVCGVGLNYDIYCADENIGTNPNWFNVPGELRQVVVRGNSLYGVNANNEIYYSPSFRNPAWLKLSGNLRVIQYDGTTLCGTNMDDDVFCANSGLDSNPNWEGVGGKLTFISVSAGGRLFGTNRNGEVYSGRYGTLSGGSCLVDADCPAGTKCVIFEINTAGLCGNSDDAQEVEYSAGQAPSATRRVLIQDIAFAVRGSSAYREVQQSYMLAPLANDAYSNPPTASINKFVPITGSMVGNAQGDWPWLGVTVYQNQDTHNLVIAFKGSQNFHDFHTDLKVVMTRCDLYQSNGVPVCGFVHSGFLNAYKTLKAQLMPVIQNAYNGTTPIYITGHSLGGAISVLCGMDLAAQGFKIAGISTFGTPRIGNSDFEMMYDTLMNQKQVLTARIAAVDSTRNAQDMVTMLAPVDVPELPYDRPVKKIIIGESSACPMISILPCGYHLHSMESSYMPMIEKLFLKLK